MMETIQNKIGSVLQGRYRIVGFLGRGGMGAVYQCEDLRLSGKRWAVKEMLVFDPASQDQIEESFKREAQMLSRLRHRNLPMIVDYFIEESKQYLVMEYIEGENMAQVIQREGPSTELQAMRWALELSQVLDYLHRQEKPVIFRDLKPDNIIITEDRHIKLVDFGLARQFDPGKRRDTQASGSVGYAPPEQWEDAAQTDERSDVYSLGATLYHVLTGRAPSPVYGSQRLRPHRPDLDPACEAIVLKCLQPDPAQRYANSGELIRDLLLWLSKQPQPSASERTSERETQPPPATPSSETITASASSTTTRPPAPPRPPLTPPWLLRFMQTSTVIFLAAASLGLHQFWAAQQPPPVVVDPLQKTLEATADDKEKARNLIAGKKYAEAIHQLDALITRYPEDAEAHILSQNTYVLFQNKPYYRIPVLTSTSGNDREGVQLYPGLALAQKQINQNGVRNHLILLDLYDSASRQDQAIELAGRIVKDRDYQVVLGPWTSQQVIATAPIFDHAGIPALAPAASDPRVLATGRHIFTASESDTQRVSRIASYLWNSQWKRAAVFYAQDNVVSGSEKDIFTEAFGKLGGEVVALKAYNSSDPEFSEALEALDKSQPVDCVFLAEYRTDVVLRFNRQLRKQYPKLPLATQVASSAVMAGGKEVDGMITSTYFHPEANSPRIREFVNQFSAQFGSLRPSHRESNAYDSLKLICDGIQAVGFDRKALTEYLHEVGQKRSAYQGVSGDFAPGRHLERRTPYLVVIHGGRYQLIDR